MIETDKIYNMDCLEGMSRMPEGSVDAIIADLPYGVLNRGNRSACWDRQIPLGPLWEQYRRIIKPDSPIILFAQGIFSAHLMLSQPGIWRYNLVWQKDRVTGHLNANRMPLRQHEGHSGVLHEAARVSSADDTVPSRKEKPWTQHDGRQFHEPVLRGDEAGTGTHGGQQMSDIGHFHPERTQDGAFCIRPRSLWHWSST